MINAGKKSLIAFAVAFFAIFAAFADDSDSAAYTSTDNVKRAQIAMSNNEYLVTAGDIYSLVYDGSSMSLAVDSSYRVRIANLGIINARGLTLQEFKNRVETLIASNFPAAAVQLFLSNPSEYHVFVRGEVTSAATVSTWALQPLSEIVDGFYTSYSSRRFVIVISEDGTEKQYDFYRYTRYGERDQNPYLRPGDTIIVPRIDRSIAITGSVRRPGTYEILPEEDLKELIMGYADGFDRYANKDSLTLSHFVGGPVMYVDTQYKEADLEGKIQLANYDKVHVPSARNFGAVFYVEGAVNRNYDYESKSGSAGEANGTVTTGPNSTGILKIAFSEGITCRGIVLDNPLMFVNSADLSGAYLLRTKIDEDGNVTSERTEINLELFLHPVEGLATPDDIELRPNDRLVIPYMQYYVTVTGGVVSPGRYSYLPDRDWNYYVNLAMGFDYDQALFKIVKITDKDGRKLSKKSAIPPEAIIYAQRNSPRNGWLIPMLTTVISFATALLTFITFTGDWRP